MDIAPEEIAAFLKLGGVDPDRIERAAAGGTGDLVRLAQALVVLGGVPTLRGPQAWEAAGATEHLGRTLWRAMGFPDLPDDLVALTDADVEALRHAVDYMARTGADEENVVRFTRLLGQTMSRIADALLSIVFDGEGGDNGEVTPAEWIDFSGQLLDDLIDHEVRYLLRRHLYAGLVRRSVAGPDDGGGISTELAAVGFADVVSFTRLSGQMAESDLADLLEWFEATTSDAITAAGGRVVKLIGDAVLFTFYDADAAARTALHLSSDFGGDHPELRVGLAHGAVIPRLGDVFGPTVNLASRLVGFARPGTVVADAGMVDALTDRSGVVARPIRPRDLKGIGTTSLFVLRRDPNG